MTNILVMISLGEIGERISSARKENRLTQLELATRAGVSRPTIDLLENGRATEIGYSKLARILAVLGLEFRLQPISPQRPTLDDLLKEDAESD
jgi:transcriptional regulator with XRE-family HTH domain